MTTDQKRRIREIFEAVASDPPGSRDDHLKQICGGDTELLSAVGKLLKARDRADGVLDTPVQQRPEPLVEPVQPGTDVGPYKVLRALGEGGMGIVYQVVRSDAVFRRVAALKIIRPEHCSGTLLERFRQERHILARLDHVNIARIVDGGSTESGLPYFVMDYIDGPPIDSYCARYGLSVRERLALFLQVCSAIQYLHDNRVIHGDLKPPNLLVNADGMVKILDFGVARLVQGEEAAAESAGPMPLMTPAYASPEQLRQQPARFASDIYALGVILYELLTGTRPFPSANTLAQFVTAVTTQDPRPPSAVDASLSRSLKGDPDSIVLRAIQRDPRDRYPSVKALERDITNYLECRPVDANSAGFGYATWKFLRRNAARVSMFGIVGLLLGVTAWEGFELREAKLESQRREAATKVVLDNFESKFEEMARKYNELRTRTASTAEPVQSAIAGNGADVNLLGGMEAVEIRKLADSYRTSFSESVRLWPGMTSSRRALLDQAGQFLHRAEPFAEAGSNARQQLALAWLWLADVQGNPNEPNLHDRSGAAASIQESQRLLENSGAPAQLKEEVDSAFHAITGK